MTISIGSHLRQYALAERTLYRRASNVDEACDSWLKKKITLFNLVFNLVNISKETFSLPPYI